MQLVNAAAVTVIFAVLAIAALIVAGWIAGGAGVFIVLALVVVAVFNGVRAGFNAEQQRRRAPRA